jgi:hypothetical protein
MRALADIAAEVIEGYKAGFAGEPIGFVSAAFDCGWTHGAQERAMRALNETGQGEHGVTLPSSRARWNEENPGEFSLAAFDDDA